MKFSQNKLLGIFIGIVFLIVLMVAIQPKSVDWSQSYSQEEKIPYGNYILRNLLPELFPGKNIKTTTFPIYNVLHADTTLENRNYIFINSRFHPDELDARELMRFVSEGNTVFIAAGNFGAKIADTLNLDTGFAFLQDDSLQLDFVNPRLRSAEAYIFRRGVADFFFTRFDTANTTILATNQRGKPHFIKIRFGRGSFLLNSVPLAFTNYNMLFRNNEEYVSRALSYLPVRDTLWDEYYKVGKQLVRTPLRFILTQEPLKWAYGVGIVCLLLFILVEAKRRQRAIPLIEPPANETLSFVTTLGQLYYHNRDHKDLAEKQITFFLDNIRRHLYLKTDDISKHFYQAVATKSGMALAEVEALFAAIGQIHQKKKITEAELHRLNTLLEKFYSHLGSENH